MMQSCSQKFRFFAHMERFCSQLFFLLFLKQYEEQNRRLKRKWLSHRKRTRKKIVFFGKYLFQSLGEILKAPDSLTSGKIIPTGRRKPNASPQLGKVSSEFVNSSLRDKKPSDIDSKLLKLCLDAVIDFHKRYPDSKNSLHLEIEEMDSKEQNSCLFLKEKIPVIKNWKFTRRTTEQKTRRTFKRTSEKKVKNQKRAGAIASRVHFQIDRSLQGNLHNAPCIATVIWSIDVSKLFFLKIVELSSWSARLLSYSIKTQQKIFVQMRHSLYGFWSNRSS